MRGSNQLLTLVFLLDENVSAKTYHRLKRSNFLVKSAKKEQLLGMKNGALLSICKQKKWVLITHDQEFLSPDIKEHYGIIVVKIHPAIDTVAGIKIESFLKGIDDKSILSKIIILEKNTWRYMK
jgi:hypothetical protein